MAETVERRAPRRSRPVQVAEAIKSWMVEQGLRQGDRLPGEAAMIARFAMAKGTIREAMRILEAEGLVVTRTGPGGGSFVAAVPETRARALLANYFYFAGLTIQDVYALRRALEPELAAALAGRLSEPQLAALEATLALYPEPAADAEAERAHHLASLRFHGLLAEYADNRLLGFVIGFMAQILAELTVWKGLHRQPNTALWREGRAHQEALVGALRRGDAEAARRIMASHMEVARALMEAQEAEMARRFMP